MKVYFLSILLIFTTWTSAFAQDPLSTLKTGNINHINPSLVGAQSDFGTVAQYRNQYPKLPGNFQTYSLLTNYNLNNGLGFGFELMSDVGPIVRTDALKLNTNYTLHKNDLELRFGLNVGLTQWSLDTSILRYEDQINPTGGFTNETTETYDPKSDVQGILDFGISGYYKGFMVGLSAMQLNQPSSVLPTRYVAMLGYHKKLSNALNLAAVSTFRQQNKFTTLETQMFGQYKFIKLGFGHRANFGEYKNYDILSGSAGIQFDKFALGYSYENALKENLSGGTHQAFAAWYIKGLNRENGMSNFLNTLL